jgi:HEAT repeat protein
MRHYPPEVAWAFLTEVLRDDDVAALLKVEAVKMLAFVDRPEVFEILLEQANSPSADLVVAAVEALGHRLDPRARPRLVELLRHPNDTGRKEAQAALEAIRFYLSQAEAIEPLASAAENAPALRELCTMLEADEPAVRIAAAQALGRLGAGSALPALIRHRRDPDPAVRQAIEEALDAIAEK